MALTIAGFDPSGGAGILADVRTFAAFACRPAAAITSLTFQSQKRVAGAEHQSPQVVASQVRSIIEQHSIAGAKTGMMPTAEIVRMVADLFRTAALPAPIVDPVMQSTSGFPLMETGALPAIISELFPIARLVTPNIPEAEAIIGRTVTTEAGMLEAARAIRALGARAVLIKGGHLMLPQNERGGFAAVDVLDDQGRVQIYRSDWIDGRSVRGTGCMLSAAIAAGKAHGHALSEAVENARRFVADAIRAALD